MSKEFLEAKLKIVEDKLSHANRIIECHQSIYLLQESLYKTLASNVPLKAELLSELNKGLALTNYKVNMIYEGYLK